MTLYIEEYGVDNASTILFIHGAALGGWMWRPQIDGLSKQFHCLVPDLPEHGKSEGQFSLSHSTDVLADIIQSKAHGGKAYVVGLSLGGLITIELMHQHPQRIEKVIVSAPPSGPVPGTSILILMTYLMLPVFKSDFVIRRTADQLNLPEDFYQHFRHAQKSMRGRLLRQVARDVHNHRLPDSLRESSIPTLAVVGEKEVGINFRVVRDLVKLMPSAQGRVAPNVNHGWNGENPSLFNQMIADWFDEGSIPEMLLPLSDVN